MPQGGLKPIAHAPTIRSAEAADQIVATTIFHTTLYAVGWVPLPGRRMVRAKIKMDPSLTSCAVEGRWDDDEVFVEDRNLG